MTSHTVTKLCVPEILRIWLLTHTPTCHLENEI